MRGAAHNVHATEASSVRQHVVAAHQPQDATCGVQHTTRSVQHGAYRLARTAQAVVGRLLERRSRRNYEAWDTGRAREQRSVAQCDAAAAAEWHGGAHVNLEFRYGTCDSLLAAHGGIRAPRIVINGTEDCDDGAKRHRTTRPVGLRYPQARLFGWGCQQPRAHRGRSGEGLLSECACARARAGAGL